MSIPPDTDPDRFLLVMLKCSQPGASGEDMHSGKPHVARLTSASVNNLPLASTQTVSVDKSSNGTRNHQRGYLSNQSSGAGAIQTHVMVRSSPGSSFNGGRTTKPVETGRSRRQHMARPAVPALPPRQEISQVTTVTPTDTVLVTRASSARKHEQRMTGRRSANGMEAALQERHRRGRKRTERFAISKEMQVKGAVNE
ncbi:unnamed protein product [Protopolystoma xenopodis]|uniref:Uncharacterized protein n=1 Tax=Protopolystoma xenopodis TaxID=117903 RepID=A0A3S5BHA8_9PLAT|nr:unnamed protein product [Protopolystoma xenopodis]